MLIGFERKNIACHWLTGPTNHNLINFKNCVYSCFFFLWSFQISLANWLAATCIFFLFMCFAEIIQFFCLLVVNDTNWACSVLLQAKKFTASSIIKLVIKQNIQCQVKSELIVDPVNNTQILLRRLPLMYLMEHSLTPKACSGDVCVTIWFEASILRFNHTRK